MGDEVSLSGDVMSLPDEPASLTEEDGCFSPVLKYCCSVAIVLLEFEKFCNSFHDHE